MTEDERIFVCDCGNDRILYDRRRGKRLAASELDVSEHGKPWDLSVQDGFLNVLIHDETEEGYEGWVQQFALPPTLEP